MKQLIYVDLGTALAVYLFSCCCCCISSLRPLLRLEIPQTTLKELTRCLYMFVINEY